MMRYPTAASFRRALEDRLNRRARTTGEAIMRLRKNVVFQRLLARLLTVSPDRWILKGGLALDFRLSDRGARPRATKDMDLARRGELAAADADFRRVQDIDLEDHFEFIVQRVELPEEDKAAGGAGLRYRVQATLAGRLFEEVLVDVGAASPTTVPEVVEGPDLLDFAGLEPVRVPALPVTHHVAEKVHAYTRRYGLQDAPSSRPKDLVDLVLLATHEPFIARDLRAALDETFSSRATHALPSELPPPPAEWARPYADLAKQVGIALELTESYERARTFLDPILSATASEDERWEAASRRWVPPERDGVE
jgi:hypothetical protein